MDQITTHATTSRVGSAAEAPAAPVDAIDFLQPNSDFEDALRSTKESSSRFRLFYHLAYLQAFGKTAPYGRLSEKTIERISFVLDETIPSSFTNPVGRSSFFSISRPRQMRCASAAKPQLSQLAFRKLALLAA